jgi:hypothetical protein
MADRRDNDKARETRQVATPYDEHRQRLREQEAKLEQTDQPEEGEREPEGDVPDRDPGMDDRDAKLPR